MRCPNCNYDVTGLTDDACPECGLGDLRATHARIVSTRRETTIILVLAIGAACLPLIGHATIPNADGMGLLVIFFAPPPLGLLIMHLTPIRAWGSRTDRRVRTAERTWSIACAMLTGLLVVQVLGAIWLLS